MKRAFIAVLLLLGALGGLDAHAHTCTVQVTPLAFGGYVSPGGARVDSTASVQVNCTPTYLLLACSVSYTLAISHGTHGTPGARQMAAGAGRLRYDLYRDATRTVTWGDGGGGGGVVGGSITSGLLGLVCAPGTRYHSVYGRIPASQNVPSGSYQDQVVLTITY